MNIIWMSEVSIIVKLTNMSLQNNKAYVIYGSYFLLPWILKAIGNMLAKKNDKNMFLFTSNTILVPNSEMPVIITENLQLNLDGGHLSLAFSELDKIVPTIMLSDLRSFISLVVNEHNMYHQQDSCYLSHSPHKVCNNKRPLHCHS